MRRSFGSVVLVAAVAALMMCPSAQASKNGSSISIAFARDEPAGQGCALDPATVVGAPGYESGNWVNEMLNKGTDSTGVTRDDKGVAATTGATVTWSSNNTWASMGRGENNNNLDGGFGPNFDLMTGYLDSSNRHDGNFDVVTITNLPADIAVGYSVVLYTLGGVRGRFALYTVNGSGGGGGTLSLSPGGDDNGVDNMPKNDDYYQALGDPTFGDASYGNYAVFTGLSGDLSIKGTPVNFRAALNAVQIIKN
jgi:hypothetical protein